MVEHELTHLRRHGHTLPERVEIGTMVGSAVAARSSSTSCCRAWISCRSAPTICCSSSMRPTAAIRGCRRTLRSDLGAVRARTAADRAQGPRAPQAGDACAANWHSKPIGALTLVAIGYRSLSLTPSAVGPVKSMLLDLDAEKALAADRPGCSTIPKPAADAAPTHRSVRVGAKTFSSDSDAMLPQQPNSTSCSPAMRKIEARSPASSAPDDFVKLSRELSDLGPVVDAIKTYRAVGAELKDVEALIDDPKTDSEMREIADSERHELRERLETLEKDIQLELLPKDAMDERNVILEIRAGTGGDEASLFAGVLFRMYERYAAKQGWKVEIVSGERRHYRRLQGNHRRHHRPRRVRQAEIRIRRASRSARAGYRSLRAASTPRPPPSRCCRRRKTSTSTSRTTT